MPPPSSENDLKRHARRRLIGAVALTLAAIILLPLLLEDEPPPASQLDVRMPAAATAGVQTATGPAALAQAEPAPAVEPAPPDAQPAPVPESAAETKPQAETKPEPKPEPKTEPKSAPQPEPKPQPAAKAGTGAYVVQLAALSDPAKAEALKARAALSGMPVFTDSRNGLTRVRVGPFESRQAADAAQAKLKDQGLDGRVVAK